MSRKGSDTSEHGTERRLAAGYPSRLLVKKTEELTRNLALFAEEVAKAAHSKPLRVLEGDARRLEGVDAGSVALVATSPPYPGNYDYLAHHAARLRWLRLSEKRFDEAEIGARRHLEPLGADDGRKRFADELAAVLRAQARVLVPGGAVILLLADSVVASAPIYAADLTAAVAARTGYVVHASASQARPHFHLPTERAFNRRAREEHALLLVRA